MTTTTRITNIARELDLTAYVGEFIGDYDMPAVYVEYVYQLNCDIPDWVTVYGNGDVIADADHADQAREIDWYAVLKTFSESGQLDRILQRHDRTTR